MQGDKLGQPLRLRSINAVELRALIKAAGVKRIKFHGTRHTMASVMLQAAVPTKVIQERPGYSNIATTMDVYVHLQPGMDLDASIRFGKLLNG